MIFVTFDLKEIPYCRIFKYFNFTLTRKYPLRGYFLGVLMHTTAWDRLWGGDYTLKGGSIYVALLHLD